MSAKLSVLLASVRTEEGMMGGTDYKQEVGRSNTLDFYCIHSPALWLRTTGILGAQWVFRLLSF